MSELASERDSELFEVLKCIFIKGILIFGPKVFVFQIDLKKQIFGVFTSRVTSKLDVIVLVRGRKKC